MLVAVSFLILPSACLHFNTKGEQKSEMKRRGEIQGEADPHNTSCQGLQLGVILLSLLSFAFLTSYHCYCGVHYKVSIAFSRDLPSFTWQAPPRPR